MNVSKSTTGGKVGMLNLICGQNWNHAPRGRRENACDHGLLVQRFAEGKTSWVFSRKEKALINKTLRNKSHRIVHVFRRLLIEVHMYQKKYGMSLRICRSTPTTLPPYISCVHAILGQHCVRDEVCSRESHISDTTSRTRHFW